MENGDTQIAVSGTTAARRVSPQSIDLWKFFEERGSKLKESLVSVSTWMLGLATALLGFAVREGFAQGSGLGEVAHPRLVIGTCVGGLILIAYAFAVTLDYAGHINRIFARASAAADGASTPHEVLSQAPAKMARRAPNLCLFLYAVDALFATVYLVLLQLALTSARR